MDNHRLILFAALSFIVLLLYQAWQEQFHPRIVSPSPASATSTVGSQIESPATNTDTPSATNISGDLPRQASGVDVKPLENAANQAPSDAQQANAQNQGATVAPTATASSTNPPVNRRIKVKTDLLHVEFDSIGADIRKVTLNKYPIEISKPDNPLVLFSDNLPDYMIMQSGFLGASATDTVNHLQNFDTEKDNYELTEGENKLTVVFTRNDNSGRETRKIYTFERNKYLIDYRFELRNAGDKAWRGQFYRQIKRNEPSKQGSRFVYTYTGGVISQPDDIYEKVKFEDMNSWKPEQEFEQGGWVAMIQHYFLGAIIPGSNDINNFYTKISSPDGTPYYIVGLKSKFIDVAPGTQASIDSHYFIGPKEQNRLEAANENLRLTVDYGVLTVLARPLYWLLEHFYDWFHNWGVAIILVTLLVKAVFYKLSEKSYRSMAKMRKFQPKVQALKERYGDDKQRFSQAMMELYRKEKMNPFGGCLPMLVQIPVFISLYWVLLESVELRQADFIFWIHDLSSKDPYYVLPLLMGISMFVQQKLNPSLMDPVQQKVMQLLPVIFTVFMAWFPSGLVLYWVVNNVLGILQQWYITRKIESQQ